MTSSLVGSEMCIRDRRGDQGIHEDSQPPAVATRHSCSGERRASSTEPVSYTHLTLPTICSV
eukprot:1189403-Prorocentrum_lima.AAC.1